MKFIALPFFSDPGAKRSNIAGMQLPPALPDRLTSFAELPLEQNAIACRTAVIDFLALLLYEKPAPETVHPVYYTRS